MLLLALLPVPLTAGSEKQQISDQIQIEHGEIILPARKKDPAQVYLTIWNGTGNFVYVTSVKDERNHTLTAITSLRREGKVTPTKASMPILVPPRSEILMKEDGLRLVLNGAEGLSKKSTHMLLVEFENGQQMNVDATVMPYGSDPTDHHHGTGDVED